MSLERYGLPSLNGGSRSLKCSMADMVRSAAQGCGLHSIIDRDRYTITHHVVDGRELSGIKDALKKSSASNGFELTPIQVETVLNCVWRPTSRVEVGYDVRRDGHPSTRVVRKFKSPVSDIGSPVFLDLPPGMGKTIVACIASLLLSVERMDKIPDQGVHTSNTGCVEVGDREPDGGRVSMIFCPKHVHHQWMFAATKAAEIISSMYPSKGFLVGANKTAGSLSEDDFDFALIVCDSSSFGLTKALEASVVYGSLCFDECTENCDIKNNAVYSVVPSSMIYGRLLLVSADFSKMTEYNSKMGSSKKGSMIRRVFGNNQSLEMSHAIKGRLGSYAYGGNAATTRATPLVACLTMNAVFPRDQRETVVGTSADLLSGVDLHTFGISYRRSIFERLGASAAFDLTPANGADRFMDAVGVDITGCDSIDEILERVESTRSAVHHRIDRRAERALQVLGEVVKEDCAVCLEKMSRASIIQPCFHVVCTTCLPRLDTCPMCRITIDGAVSSNVVGKRTFEGAFGTDDLGVETGTGADVRPTGSSIGEEFALALSRSIPVNDGSLAIQDTMSRVLTSLSAAHDRSGGGTFRAILVCSKVDLNTTGFEPEGFCMMRYRTKGTKGCPVTRKKLVKLLESFQEDDGEKKLMLVHDETSRGSYAPSWRSRRDDNITGLDFPKLDAVISIGSENRAQRVGRLCRLSRVFMEQEKRDAIYVELSGV